MDAPESSAALRDEQRHNDGPGCCDLYVPKLPNSNRAQIHSECEIRHRRETEKADEDVAYDSAAAMP